jgi:dihydroorotate dehydrogenase electron transfer subunit
MNATADTVEIRVSRAARIVTNERIEGGCHRIEAELIGSWPDARAGQFCMLSLDHPNFPLLPRPFSLLGSVSEDGGGRVEFMIMPVGIGSGLLCAASPGETLNVVGPMGHALDEDLPDGPIVCVAGGYGVAPFLFLAEQWRREGHAQADDLSVVFGARTADRLSLAARLEDAVADVLLCTDDGSCGFAGRVDTGLQHQLVSLAAKERPATMILTCGPEPMMEAVGRVCREHGIPGRASLETYMGCGYAVCNGCAVAVDSDGEADGYTYELACREGTLFDAERLRWNLL